MSNAYMAGVCVGLAIGYLAGLWVGVRYVCKNLRARSHVRYIPQSAPRVPRSELPTLPSFQPGGDP